MTAVGSVCVLHDDRGAGRERVETKWKGFPGDKPRGIFQGLGFKQKVSVAGGGSGVLLLSHAGTWGMGPGLCWHPPPGVPGPCLHPRLQSQPPALRSPPLLSDILTLKKAVYLSSPGYSPCSHTHTHTGTIAPRRMHMLGQIVHLDAHTHSCEHLRGNSVSRSPHHQSPCPEQVSVTAVE